MTNLTKFWRTLDTNWGRATVHCEWEQLLGDAYPKLREHLHPIDEIGFYWPNPKVPDGPYYVIVQHYDGTYAIQPDSDDGYFESVRVEVGDVLLHRFNMTTFRKQIAGVLGLIPANTPVAPRDSVFPFGTYSPIPGKEFPVIAVMSGSSNMFRKVVTELVMTSSAPFILVSGSRAVWSEQRLFDILRDKRIPTIPLCEALEYKDGKFIPTQVWKGNIDVFTENFCPEAKEPPYLFAFKGDWELRFAGNRMVIADGLTGLFYIRYLLQHPNQPVHASELQSLVADDSASSRSVNQENEWTEDTAGAMKANDARGVIDEKAMAEYKKRLLELSSLRNKAMAENDMAAEMKIDDELEFITNELNNATSIHGRVRNLDRTEKQLRDRINRNLNSALSKIESGIPSLAQYLRNTIDRGIDLRYLPSEPIDWRFG